MGCRQSLAGPCRGLRRVQSPKARAELWAGSVGATLPHARSGWAGKPTAAAAPEKPAVGQKYKNTHVKPSCSGARAQGCCGKEMGLILVLILILILILVLHFQDFTPYQSLALAPMGRVPFAPWFGAGGQDCTPPRSLAPIGLHGTRLNFNPPLDSGTAPAFRWGCSVNISAPKGLKTPFAACQGRRSLWVRHVFMRLKPQRQPSQTTLARGWHDVTGSACPLDQNPWKCAVFLCF